MSLHKRVGLAILWAASIGAAGAWAQAPATSPQAPTVISGSDFGLRVDSWKGDTPIGTLVARVNGRWIEVEFSVGMKRLTAK